MAVNKDKYCNLSDMIFFMKNRYSGPDPLWNRINFFQIIHACQDFLPHVVGPNSSPAASSGVARPPSPEASSSAARSPSPALMGPPTPNSCNKDGDLPTPPSSPTTSKRRGTSAKKIIYETFLVFNLFKNFMNVRY